MDAADTVQLVECPRDAMQGWKAFIPTEQKIAYINSLLEVGFHTIDFGSFVSPKAIPQMADTKEVVKGLQLQNSSTKLLAIVANVRGAQEASVYDEISYLGFPFSLSPSFQFRNTNSSIEASLAILEAIQNICTASRKQLVVYLSMGFGNPYGDVYNEEILWYWTAEIVKRDVRIISLADTVGIATHEQISTALAAIIPRYPDQVVGVHLHATADGVKEKLGAAVDAGCRRIDGALKGIGGCPMAGNELVGNLNMELAISYLEGRGMVLGINHEALQKSLHLASQLFR